MFFYVKIILIKIQKYSTTFHSLFPFQKLVPIVTSPPSQFSSFFFFRFSQEENNNNTTTMAAIDTETNGAAIKAAWDSLKDAGDFVVLELNGNTLQIKAQGNNGLEGVKGNLDNSKILWGAFNVTAVDELSGVITKSQNRITFTFMGSDIGAVKKSQITQQKGTIKDKLFPGNSATFDIDDRADLDPKEVAAKLCAKAHRPKYFDFGAGVKVDV